MTNKSKTENSLAEDLQLSSALAQLSETELACLLDRVETLEADFQRVPLRKRESVEAVAVAQNLLKIWNTEVGRVLRDKQAADTYEQLHIWDNEGGMADRVPSRRVVIRTEEGERRVAWADIEEAS